jgi:hypothetical protein
MKKIILITLLLSTAFGYSQEAPEITSEKYTSHNKGKFFIFWGGNRDEFSKSDIHFKGADYDFTLYDVTAHDVPKGWHIDYINPARMTIPQTNLRIGYFLNDHYNVSIGTDHMKYVMDQNIAVKYTGNYPNRGALGDDAGNGQILLTEDFLTFEHTDGLNYIHAEVARVDDLTKIFKLPSNTDKFQLNITEGIGAGVLYPRTNAKVFNKDRYDEFHISGYGISAKAGLNFTFFKYFFIQTELKAGYINMPDIRTTYDPIDRASQHFLFFQKVIAVGGIFRL